MYQTTWMLHAKLCNPKFLELNPLKFNLYYLVAGWLNLVGFINALRTSVDGDDPLNNYVT